MGKRPGLVVHIDKEELRYAVIIYLLMFFSNDTYMFGTNHIESLVALPRFLMIGICVFCSIYLLLNNYIRLQKNKVIPWTLMLLSFVLIASIDRENLSRAVIKLLCMTSAFLLCIIIPFKKYTKAFVQAMSFVAVCSIVLTIITYISPATVRKLPSVLNTANVKLYTIIVSGIDERSVGAKAAKCGGIFWEGGVYQMYLNLAICYVLFFWGKNENKANYIAILGLALALTFSTTGYLAFAWMIGIYYLIEKAKISNPSSMLSRFFLLLIGCASLYSVAVFTPLWNIVFSKIFDTSHGSTMVRLASVLVNVELFLEKPLTGWGMEIIPDEFQRRSYLSPYIIGWTRQNTNTLLYQFAAHGVVWGTLFTIGTYDYCKLFSRKLFVVIGVFIMILMLYLGENLMTSLLPYTLIFYGFDYKNERFSCSTLRAPSL